MTILVPERQCLFGLEVDALTMEETVALAAQALTSRRPLLIGVINAAKVVRLRADSLLRDSLLACDVTVADGQSVVWASKLLRRPLPERVAGIDLFENLLDLADQKGYRVYFLGARPGVLATMLDEVAARWPNLVVAGSRDGYFSPDESGEVAEGIARSGADMLFLGMGTPSKEIFLGTYGEQLGVPILHGVGGSFDVLAGLTRRAPERWQRLGLEWAYRLKEEPRRLWRRYLITNLTFLGLLGREWVHRQPPYPRLSEGSGGAHG